MSQRPADQPVSPTGRATSHKAADPGGDPRSHARPLKGAVCGLSASAHGHCSIRPDGVGKSFLATALGHIACRRRISVHFERADRMLKRLKASRLDASFDAEMRKLVRVDLLALDDFAIQSMDATETADFYQLVVERHRNSSTLITSNRDPVEWLAVMADPLLAQSAVDRLQNAAYELVIEGESYRRREKPQVGSPPPETATPRRRRQARG
jgi:hypothetical protein